MNNTKRIYQIDLFRFIAAMAVVLFHFMFRGNEHELHKMSVVGFPEIGDYFKYGYLGVDLFFIISGFVISLSIRNFNLGRFVKSRFLRLYPAYWFCVTMTSLIVLIWGGSMFSVNFYQYLVNMTMFNGFVGVEHIDGVYWSLMEELKFYFIIAFYLILRRIKVFDLNVVIVAWLLLSLLSVIIDFNSHIILKVLRFAFTLFYSSYFIAGMIFYKIYKEGVNYKYILGLLVCLGISMHYATGKIIVLETNFGSPFSPVIICTFVISFYIIMFLASTQKLNLINSPKLIKLGVLTYPLYLIHENIGFIIFNETADVFNKYLGLILILALMLWVSHLISVYIEKPLSTYLKRSLEKANSILFLRKENLR